jgi:penicillin-binding protein 2
LALFTPETELSRLKARYVVMLILISIVFMVLAGRLFFLQVSRGAVFDELSHSNIVSVRRDVAIRGMIFDRKHRLLVDNRPEFNLYFTPKFCHSTEFETTIMKLTRFIGLTEPEVERMTDYYNKQKGLDRLLPLLVRRELSWPELAAVEQHKYLLKGVEIRAESSRSFPKGNLAAHLLGYVGEISSNNLKEFKERAKKQGELEEFVKTGYRQGDVVGKYGIEKAWEEELRGENGLKVIVVDSHGQPAPDSVAKKVRLGPEYLKKTIVGGNLILSLDARLQELVEKRFPGEEGAVVALNPQTGFILAMLSRPDFDPNQMSGRIDPRLWREIVKDPYRPLLNRATQQHYPPGSTFKAFTALAALETEAFTPDKSEHCSGRLRFGGHLFRCWKKGGHGRVAVHKAIVQSCDVYFYRAGVEAGIDAVANIAKEFGFGTITGFDSAREVPGIIPDKKWYAENTKTGFLPGFTLSASIGQGDVNVTPLQLALSYAAIGNGGKLYRPQIVSRIETPDGKVVEEFEPIISRTVSVSEESLKIVADGLAGVVNEPGGTGFYRRPRKVEFQVAGKTGTAQVVKQGEERGKDLPYDFKDHAWFAAYAPIENPQIAVVVVNEHGGHGSSGAAPLAMEIITYYLEKLEKQE